MADDPEKFSQGSLTAVPQIAGMLGEFIAAFGLLEQSLRMVLASVLGISTDAAEAILYALRNTSAKIDIICEVTSRKSHPRQDEILDAMSEVGRIAGRRNTYLHAVIGVGPGPRAVMWDFRFPLDQGERRKDLTVDDLEELIFETTDAYNFLALAINGSGQPPPWRSKYFQSRGEPGTGSKRRRQKLNRRRKRPPPTSPASLR